MFQTTNKYNFSYVDWGYKTTIHGAYKMVSLFSATSLGNTKIPMKIDQVDPSFTMGKKDMKNPHEPELSSIILK